LRKEVRCDNAGRIAPGECLMPVPRSGVRWQVLPAGVRSLESKPKGSLFHPGTSR
jgi:hypothetical protein